MARPRLVDALRRRLLRKERPGAVAGGPRLGGRPLGSGLYGRGLKGKAARDHARVFRDLVSGWTAQVSWMMPLTMTMVMMSDGIWQDLHCLVVEYEAGAAVRELTWRADAARPPFPTLGQDLGRILDTGVAADVRLAFDGAEFPAHAPILCARSAFFRRLLAGAKPSQRVEVLTKPARSIK